MNRAPSRDVRILSRFHIDYQAAWEWQTQLQQELIARKRQNHQNEKEGLPPQPIHHYLLFVEHPPVYTLGKSGSTDHLLLDETALKQGGFQFFKINRGGDITYHGWGQLVVYPIFDLEDFFTDVHRYVRSLEEVIIRTLADYGIPNAYRDEGYTGVWLPAKNSLPKRKICAIGVHLSRWVSLHGLAFNVQPDLSHFNNIIPCGIQEADRSVTSLHQETGKDYSPEELMPTVLKHFREVFEF